MPEMRVDLSANSAQFGRDLAVARGHLIQAGDAFRKVGGVAGDAGEKMAHGLKRGVGDFRELAHAAGLAGGEIGKVGGVVAEIVLGGFNPLALAIAGAGVAFGALSRESSRSMTVTADAVARGARELRAMRVELDDIEKGTKNARLQRFKDDIEDSEKAIRDLGGSIGQYGVIFNRFLDAEGKVEPLTKEQTNAVEALRIAREKLAVAIQTQAAEEKKATKTQTDSVSMLRTVEEGYSDAIEITKEYGKTLDEVTGRVRALREAEEERQERIRAFYADRSIPEKQVTSTSMGIWNQDDADANAAMDKVVELKEEIKELDPLTKSVTDRMTAGLSGDLGGAFTDAIMGAKGLKEGIGDAAKSIVADLIRMTITAIAFRAIMAAITGGTVAPIPIGAGVANSGNVNPGGNVADTFFSGSYGKSMKVDVHNYNGSSVSVAEGMDSDGTKRLEVFVEEAAAKSVARGGKLWHAMQSASGASRQPRRRG